jgi:hypothetical protein
MHACRSCVFVLAENHLLPCMQYSQAATLPSKLNNTEHLTQNNGKLSVMLSSESCTDCLTADFYGMSRYHICPCNAQASPLWTIATPSQWASEVRRSAACCFFLPVHFHTSGLQLAQPSLHCRALPAAEHRWPVLEDFGRRMGWTDRL